MSFKHPGLLNNQAELDLIKLKVEAKAEPWYTAYLQLAVDPYHLEDYRLWVPQAVSNYCWDGITEAGGYFLARDGRAAYACALQWVVTGDISYAQEAIKVFNSWAYTLKTVSEDCGAASNTRLAVGGMLPPMIYAAEIIRTTYNGWSQADQNKFKDMIALFYYPMTRFVNYSAPDCTWGGIGGGDKVYMNTNSGAMGAQTRMAIGIYIDNQNYFDEAVRDFKYLIEHTFRSDGKYIETCRYQNDVNTMTCSGTVGGDLDHTQLSLMAFVAMAEMAKKQGIDLYGYKDPTDGNSLLTTLLYHEPFIGYPSRVPYGNPATWPCQIPLQNALGVMNKESFWAMAANHYQHPALKSVAEWVGTVFSGWGSIGWDTLTHNYYGQIKEDNVTPIQPTPYKGTSFSIPGKINAVDFDIGGEGVAYHDVDSWNRGNAYRQEGVDIEPCSEGGFNVGWMSKGEWLVYSINVQTSGKYDFILRVASNVSGTKRMHIEIDGVDVTGPLTFTDASGWQTWKDLKAIGINLTAGNHLMKVVFDTGNHNLNYIDLVLSDLSIPEYMVKKNADGIYSFVINLDSVKYQVEIKKI